jgi:hypothetical protein
MELQLKEKLYNVFKESGFYIKQILTSYGHVVKLWTPCNWGGGAAEGLNTEAESSNCEVTRKAYDLTVENEKVL